MREERTLARERTIDDLMGSIAPGSSRVERDGIALVHEGEWIVPVDGAEAMLRAIDQATTLEVPISIDVGAGITAAERESIIQETLRRLRRAVESR